MMHASYLCLALGSSNEAQNMFGTNTFIKFSNLKMFENGFKTGGWHHTIHKKGYTVICSFIKFILTTLSLAQQMKDIAKSL
jgi:hypothetical protein